MAIVDKRIADEIAQGWDLLEEGDIEGARAAHARARRRAESGRQRGAAEPPELAELWALGGAIAERDGDAEAALAAFQEAHARDPGEPRYLLSAAEVALGALDATATAVDLCNRALDVATEDDDLVHAILLKAEALIGLGHDHGEDDEARELLSELAGCAIDDPEVWCRAGDIYLALGDLDPAEHAYGAAVALDDTWADAHHGLGTVHHERGDHARTVAAWQRVRALDLEAPPAGLQLDPDEFERVAEDALAELPEDARAHLENVPLLVDDVPSEELVAEGVDPRLLGLFSGVPLPHKSHVAGQVPQLDAIYLFQRNLERACHSLERLAEEIRITVLHETAHFFGLEDDDLHAIGLG